MSDNKSESSGDDTGAETNDEVVDDTDLNEETGDETETEELGDEEPTRVVEDDVENGGGGKGIIPELHDDVFKAPFRGYDTSNLDDISDAVGQMSTEAGIRIEEVHREKETLRKKVEALEEQLQQNKREFQKYKQRKASETEELKDTATKTFIKDALPIRDDLGRALNEDNDNDDIRSGVTLIKQNFDELLEKEGVNLIQPEFGDEVDPERHKVMSRVESEAPNGTVVECFRTGYEFEELIIRPARITVSNSD